MSFPGNSASFLPQNKSYSRPNIFGGAKKKKSLRKKSTRKNKKISTKKRKSNKPKRKTKKRKTNKPKRKTKKRKTKKSRKQKGGYDRITSRENPSRTYPKAILGTVDFY